MKHFILAILMFTTCSALAKDPDQIPYAKQDIVIDGNDCLDCPITHAKKVTFHGKAYAVQYQDAGGWSSDGNHLVAVCNWANYASVNRCTAERSIELITVYNKVLSYYGIKDLPPIEIPSPSVPVPPVTPPPPVIPDNLDSGSATAN